MWNPRKFFHNMLKFHFCKGWKVKMSGIRALKIYQINEGYCYNSDSLFLWDFARAQLHNGQKVLEIGSGSGVIGLLCARDLEISLFQVELQREYALLNLKNATHNNIFTHIINVNCLEMLDGKTFKVDVWAMSGDSNPLNGIALWTIEKLGNAKSAKISKDSIESKGEDSKESSQNAESKDAEKAAKEQDLLRKIDSKILNIKLEYFDVLISNPPFYTEGTLESKNTFKKIATQDIYLPLEQFILVAKKCLKPSGKLIFCYSVSSLARILSLLETHNFGVEKMRFIYPRLDKNAIRVMIVAKRNAKPQTLILPPLITHLSENQSDNSPEVQKIYKDAKTQSVKVDLDSMNLG